ncbi:rhodanese-like domain-containing protein [Streptomyces sp. NPDC058319]|uniref:rhodanese-like domain-containing protein n=1 Tax=unclassified Streptomyces TaxID=2593676 RepID=UPI0033B59493
MLPSACHRCHRHHRRPDGLRAREDPRAPGARRPRRPRRWCGPAALSSVSLLPALVAGQVKALLADGAQVVDVRPAADYAAGHIPGSLAIPLRGQFAT